MKKKIDSTLFTSILYIVVGILLAVFPGDMLKWAMLIAGIFFIVSGALELVKKNWVGGAISLIIGVAIILGGWLFLSIVLLVLGILIAIKGVTELVEVLKLKKKKRTFFKLIFPIITIIVGLALAFGNALDYVILAVGVILIVDGILGLVGAKK